MRELVWLVPVLGRPQYVRPLLDSIERTTPTARVLFLADPGDEAERRAIRRERERPTLCVDAVATGGGWAAKINAGVRHTDEPLIFLGADDLRPRPGWFEAAKKRLLPPVGVVGVDDLIDRPRRPQHATHFLMTREYAERGTIDGAAGPVHEGYGHWHCDDELIATAIARGAYAYAPEAQMEHLHPMVDPDLDDATYQRGRSQARTDRRTFLQRRSLWTPM